MDTIDEGNGNQPNKKDYEVGFGRPPKSGQFKPGHKRSRGRKRGSRNLRTIVEAEIFAPAIFNENGKKVRSNKLTAIIRTQTNKAAMGDPRAVNWYWRWRLPIALQPSRRARAVSSTMLSGQ